MKTYKANIINIIFGGLIFVSVNSAHAVTLFSDDFSGTSLGPTWDVQRGYATMDDGWVRTQGSTPGS
ncbi:MAG: hypothetical protein K2Q13_05425 [Nitrosomonas sp.]|uniref:hypothetical protein n=1 Tax=Nitrosomonas sp. TaxID=42353 RepID=UPI0025EBE637|nr:hypothetical protein [Nitrosomonas sp.]MBY0474493.1 hypothetical protein [Nitrosomonas sp.]